MSGHDVLHYRSPGTPISLVTTYAAAGYGIALGLSILMSADTRFESATYTAIRDIHTPYGVFALVFGLTILFAMGIQSFWLKAVGLIGLTTWSGVFAWGAIDAMTVSPVAGPTAPAAYIYITINLALLVWSDVRKEFKGAPKAPRQG